MPGASRCERIAELSHVPSYPEFVADFLRPNVPCLLPSGLVKDWPIFSRLSTLPTSGSSRSLLHPAFDFLQSTYGSTHHVPVVLPPASPSECAERTEMLLADALKVMRDRKREGSAVYIKDWHLFRQERLLHKRRRRDESAASKEVDAESAARGHLYEAPFLFKDDWMNNVRKSTTEEDEPDDFAFCYAGSAGSATNLHRDVYTSYSWSTNIVGRKRWRLFPPSCIPMLRRFPDVRTSELANSCDAMDLRHANGDLGRVADGKAGWPLWSQARSHVCEIIQDPGETIFVPSNWYHEVLNLTDCISINHNWCNTYNLDSMFTSMVEEIEDVEASLADVRDMLKENNRSSTDDEAWRLEWVQIVQQVARQDAGWAWEGFWEMVQHNLSNSPTESQYRPSAAEVHAVVRRLLLRFRARPEVALLGDRVHTILKRIEQMLSMQ